MLFDEKTIRVRKDSKRANESHYDFINNSALEEISNVRKLLNACFHKYELQAQNEIKSRIVENKGDEKFFSTCFELLIFYLFTNLGYQLIEHPHVNGSLKQPDFLVTSKTGESFYLELVTIEEYDDQSVEDFKHFINSLSNNITFVHIKNFSGRKLKHHDFIELRKDIKEWWHLNKKNIGANNIWKNSTLDFITELEVMSKSNPAIQSTVVPTYFHIKLLDSLKKKAKKYGDFDRPYIIATTFRPSSFSAGLQFISETLIQTFYGTGLILDPNTATLGIPKSLWKTSSNQPSYRGVSGVLFFDELTPYRALDKFKYCLFLNNNANYPLSDYFKVLLNHYPINNNIEHRFLMLHSVFQQALKDL